MTILHIYIKLTLQELIQASTWHDITQTTLKICTLGDLTDHLRMLLTVILLFQDMSVGIDTTSALGTCSCHNMAYHLHVIIMVHADKGVDK